VVGSVCQPGKCNDAFERDGRACCCYFIVISKLGGWFGVMIVFRYVSDWRDFRLRGWDRCSTSF
jgi:hypothetical protein